MRASAPANRWGACALQQHRHPPQREAQQCLDGTPRACVRAALRLRVARWRRPCPFLLRDRVRSAASGFGEAGAAAAASGFRAVRSRGSSGARRRACPPQGSGPGLGRPPARRSHGAPRRRGRRRSGQQRACLPHQAVDAGGGPGHGRAHLLEPGEEGSPAGSRPRRGRSGAPGGGPSVAWTGFAGSPPAWPRLPGSGKRRRRGSGRESGTEQERPFGALRARLSGRAGDGARRSRRFGAGPLDFGAGVWV